jgi:hypothetical protein
VVVIDEAHTFFHERKGTSPEVKAHNALVAELSRLVEELVRKGRNVAIQVVLLTQRATGDAIPTRIRDNCQVAISFATRTLDGAGPSWVCPRPTSPRRPASIPGRSAATRPGSSNRSSRSPWPLPRPSAFRSSSGPGTATSGGPSWSPRRATATTRGRAVGEDDGYLWRGELRLWDNEILMGWYAANDGSVRSKGTMYFVMHPHGISATGRWVGLSYDGNIVTGWSSMARTEADAREIVGNLKEQDASSR